MEQRASTVTRERRINFGWRHMLQDLFEAIDARQGGQNLVVVALVAEFIIYKKVYTFSSIGDYSVPKSVRCTDSAPKWPT